MSVRPSPELPDAVVRAARLSPVPLYLRAIFSRLPESLSMTAQVGGAPEALPLAARQLLLHPRADAVRALNHFFFQKLRQSF